MWVILPLLTGAVSDRCHCMYTPDAPSRGANALRRNSTLRNDQWPHAVQMRRERDKTKPPFQTALSLGVGAWMWCALGLDSYLRLRWLLIGDLSAEVSVFDDCKLPV